MAKVQNIVELINVTKSFGGPSPVLNNVNLNIRKGEILTLLGPSGCGKTTLMRIIAGFEEPTSGQLVLSGREVGGVPPEQRNVNMVFQRYALFPHLDVFDNVAFGLRLKGLPKNEIKQKVLHMLDLVQLGDFASRWITELSGGQAQRVALARALVNSPDVLLLDEPLAALDLKIRHHMLREFKRIHKETGTTFIYVTHDQDEAMILSDTVVLMNNGTIEQVGPPQQMYGQPDSLFCARFFGETNILQGRITESGADYSDFDFGTNKIKVPKTHGQRMSTCYLSLRPESIVIEKESDQIYDISANYMQGVVDEITFIGSRVVYKVRNKDNVDFICNEPRPVEGVKYIAGEQVRLRWHPAASVLLTH